MGSTFTALESEVQNGKEKGEGRALSAQAGKPSLGPASQSKRPLCFLPPHPAGTWLGGDLAKAPVLSLVSTAELGQLVSGIQFHHWQQGEELCIPTVQWAPRKTP